MKFFAGKVVLSTNDDDDDYFFNAACNSVHLDLRGSFFFPARDGSFFLITLFFFFFPSPIKINKENSRMCFQRMDFQ